MGCPYSRQFHPHRIHNDRFRNLHRCHLGCAKCHRPRVEIDSGSLHTCTELCFHLSLTFDLSGAVRRPLEEGVRSPVGGYDTDVIASAYEERDERINMIRPENEQ